MPYKYTNKLTSNTAITLIALIITIIILLILAGITLSMVLGDNGIITKAKDAKVATEISSIKEQIKTDILNEQADNEGNISDDSLEKILLTYGKLSEEEKIIDKTLTAKGKYKIKVSDIFNGTTVKDGPKEPIFTTVANKPDIEGFDKTKTYYVAWNENTEKTVYNPDEKKMSENVAPNNWYDYTKGVNHWANIKTTGGGNDCYWVWIPRYAYKVPTKYTSDTPTAETIEIKFLQGTTNTPIDGTTINVFQPTEEKKAPEKGDWVVHPAFTEGLVELEGIWVAKFEASNNNVSEETLTSDLETQGGGNVTNLQVRVKPNVTSWRGITVNNIVTVCKNLTTTGNSLENTNNIDSHMMKNTEWGACAYLSMSLYGKNSEVWNNPYSYTKNSSPITGLCGNKSNGKDNVTSDITQTCKYNETGGGNASTTGNVYGLYDMAGGVWEYVAGIYEGGTSNESTSLLWLESNRKYVDRYKTTTDSKLNSQSKYYGNIDKYGDAVYETSSSGGSSTGSWYSSFSWFAHPEGSVFMRGGQSGNNSNSDLFAYGSHTGGAGQDYGFRPVMSSF